MARQATALRVAGASAPTRQQQSAGRINGVPNVQFVREELRRVLPLYTLVQDCIAGSYQIKAKAELYLPRPNPTDTSAENIERYKAYLLRALFYGATRRTVFALVGQIFMREPQVDIPPTLDVLKLDATGENVTLAQVAQNVAQDVLSIGRSGIHVDFPTTMSGVTVAQKANNDFRPTINSYNGKEIINWRKALRGARQVYTLIVVREDYTTGDDGFEAKTGSQYKVMRLLPKDQAITAIQQQYPDTWVEQYGDALNVLATSDATDVYRLEVWRGNSNTAVPTMATFILAEAYYPRGADGNLLNEIPWMFVGAEQNDDSVDHPPMLDLAEVNISHYRNYADFEEACFIVGQPTPVVSGVTEEWNQNVLKGAIQLGSRGVIALPNGGTATLLQAKENTLPERALDRKERSMVALGAKLIEQRAVQRTATEAQMEGTADTSILANIAKNVSVAVEWAIKKACVFTGDNPDAVSFVLNTEFDLTRMDPQERAQLLEEYVTGGIAFTEYRANLRRGGVATLDDEEAQTAIAKDDAARLAASVTKVTALAAAQPDPAAPGATPTPATKAVNKRKPGDTSSKSAVAKGNQTNSAT